MSSCPLTSWDTSGLKLAFQGGTAMLDRFTAIVVSVGVAWAATLAFATVAPNAFPIDDACILALCQELG